METVVTIIVVLLLVVGAGYLYIVYRGNKPPKDSGPPFPPR